MTADQTSMVYQAAGKCGDARGEGTDCRCRLPDGHDGPHRCGAATEGFDHAWGEQTGAKQGDTVVVSTEPLRYGTVIATHDDGTVTVEWQEDEEQSKTAARRPRPKTSLPVEGQ